MSAALTRRRAMLLSAALVTGAALFFALRPAAPPDTPPPPVIPLRPGPAITSPHAAFTPPLHPDKAAALTTAEIALQLAGWPEGQIHEDLPKWAALLAARGTEAVNDLSSALATAGSNTARGVLSDALARIGTDDAIQELCTQAIKAPDLAARTAIAESFRALSRPAAVPLLATLFSETGAEPLVTEAAAAIRRLADEAGVHALADLAQESGQLYAQRELIFKTLAALTNPDALPALEALAADTTDPDRARAAAAGAAQLKSAGSR